ncbi:MAG TPA: hypothetical protein VHE54_16630, partial [Puia sp.]|nr:hypothetical protein [Puia sp.]
ADIRTSFYVPLFSVQLLIENALKHNVLTAERPLSIGIGSRNGALTVSNNVQPLSERPEAGGGTGLLNLRERYAALSGDPVVIEASGGQFAVSIKLLSHGHRDH